MVGCGYFRYGWLWLGLAWLDVVSSGMVSSGLILGWFLTTAPPGAEAALPEAAGAAGGAEVGSGAPPPAEGERPDAGDQAEEGPGRPQPGGAETPQQQQARSDPRRYKLPSLALLYTTYTSTRSDPTLYYLH